MLHLLLLVVRLPFFVCDIASVGCDVAFLVVTRNSASDVNCSAPEYHSHSQVDTGKYDHFFIVIGTVQITILYFS